MINHVCTYPTMGVMIVAFFVFLTIYSTYYYFMYKLEEKFRAKESQYYKEYIERPESDDSK